MPNDPVDYVVKRVDTPPVLKQHNGQWFISITDGTTTLETRVGSWFLAELCTRMMIPTLVVQGRDDA